MKFEYGDIGCTPGISRMLKEDPIMNDWITDCLNRHLNGDWGGAPATGHKHCQMWHWITTEIQLPICLT